MKKISFIFFLSFFVVFAFSQKTTNDIDVGYKISGEVQGLKDTSVILAYYFGGQQYASDTAYTVNGSFIFEGSDSILIKFPFTVPPPSRSTIAET